MMLARLEYTEPENTFLVSYRPRTHAMADPVMRNRVRLMLLTKAAAVTRSGR